MNLCTARIRLAGRVDQESIRTITIPELMVLQKLHGRDAVLDVLPLTVAVDHEGNPIFAPIGQAPSPEHAGKYFVENGAEVAMFKGNQAQELERLRVRYNGPERDVVGQVWAGSNVTLPNTLAEAGMKISEQIAALEARMAADQDAVRRLRQAEQPEPLAPAPAGRATLSKSETAKREAA